MARRGEHRLYLLKFSDCPTCQEATPKIEAWVAKHSMVRLINVDLETTEWRAERWTPEKVPTLILLDPNGGHQRYEYVDGKTVDEWMRGMDTWMQQVAPEVAEEDAELVE